MAHRFETVIFDVDGTLMDTSEGILSSVCCAVRESGLPMPDGAVLRSFIGPPMQQSFARTFGLGEEEAMRAANVFRERYRGADLLKASVYPGIRELMDCLTEQKIRIAVATYKREDYAYELMKAFHFDRYTGVLLGSDFEGRLKKSDIIRKALLETGTEDRDRALMVGDSENDLAGAREAGVPFAGVTWGFGFRSREQILRQGGAYAFDSVRELGEFLTGGKRA